MDVIQLEESLVKCSHGRPDASPEHGPVIMSSMPELLPAGPVNATDVKSLLLGHLFDDAN